MSDLGKYRVSYSVPFGRSFKELKKAHYGKNWRGVNEIEELISNFVFLLGIEPRLPIEAARSYNSAIQKIKQQQFNSTEYLPHWDFKKLYFACPQLLDQARMGRLMYLIDDKAMIVRLVLIYTHQQYGERPPDGVMNTAFKQIKDEEREGL